jgi:anionic cell wall polymer biosynthesis LytR-Cps2A-Psr (LCP) family protein
MDGRQGRPPTTPAVRENEYNPLFDSSTDRTAPPPPLAIPEPRGPSDPIEPTDTRRVSRALFIFALGSVLVILLACAAVFLTVQHLTGNIPRVPNVFSGLDDSSRPAPVADRVSFLVMGTDSRQGIGQHGDAVLTLARVDVDLNPAATRASVVSIPRDAWVAVPDHGQAKISTAYGLGGPTLLVRTVEQLTHVRIDHFAVIDFAGFRQMVDAVGGIDVNGAHLGGSEALAYVSQGTASAVEYRDRLARQQTAIRALLDRTADDGLLGDPLKLFRLLDALSKAVSVDETLTSAGMDGLGLQMRGLRTSTTQFAVSPVRAIGREDGQTVIYLDEPRSEQLWSAVRNGTVDGYLKQFPGDSIKTSH